MLGDLTFIFLAHFLLMIEIWDLKFKIQKFVCILNGFVTMWSVEFEILLISFVLLTYGGLTFKIFLFGVILSLHSQKPFKRSLAFFNSWGFDLLKLFLVFCGYVNMWGQQFTSFMIFVIVVMCGATTNNFFVFLKVILCQCMKLFVLCGCVDWGKTNKDIS